MGVRRVDQEQLRRLIASGITVARISQQTGWSMYSIYTNMRQLGIHTERAKRRMQASNRQQSEIKITGFDKSEKICPECGKRFYVPNADEWAYKTKAVKGQFLCSWSCLRKTQRRVADE